MVRRAFVACMVCALAGFLAMAGVAQAQEEPQLGPGFQAMSQLIPVDVGQPLESEHHNEIGNGFQQTANGLFVWHSLTNVTDFTDGFRTWVLAPEGFLVRFNDERFDFEITQEQLEQQAEQQVEAQLEQQAEQQAEEQPEQQAESGGS